MEFAFGLRSRPYFSLKLEGSNAQTTISHFVLPSGVGQGTEEQTPPEIAWNGTGVPGTCLRVSELPSFTL